LGLVHLCWPSGLDALAFEKVVKVGAKRIDLAGDCLAVEIGAVYSQTIQYNVPVDPTVNPIVFVPVDLTGYTCKAQVRAESGYAIILELDTYITLNTPTGAIVILIPPSVTLTLPPGIYKYDLFLTDPSGNPTKLLWGQFEIRTSITVL